MPSPPVEFMIGALRAFDVGYDDTSRFVAPIRAFGRGSVARRCSHTGSSSTNWFAQPAVQGRRA
ncbi:hypothetical protein [Paraburkholderia sp. BR14320]|uniref:hypothetical protein n=1 Tax=unclassified Paraburkholderia TaxID=2615204 RepID=UPI0034CE1D71